jgi:tetratricopeptide (TPR) repeat protein
MKTFFLSLLATQGLVFHSITAQTQVEYWNSGTKCLEIQDFNCAVSNFSKYIEIEPKYIAAYMNLGVAYAKTGRLAESLATYQKGIMVATPFINDIKQEIEKAQTATNQDELKNLQLRLESQQSVLAEVYYNRADVYLSLNKPAEAMNDYNLAIQTYAKRAEFFYNRGLLKRKNKDLAGAIQDYTQAISLDNKYDIAYKNRGLAYYLSAEYAKAIKDYDVNLQFNPQDAETYYNRGLAKMGLRDRQGGCADWRKAQQLGSNRASEALVKYCK